ncbi:triple tyrosine motif-containing protein [Arabiibacter massiliensis]|uniref:triple tyrosine motif-containing protein n=1 Tax=Arabiibacter massiliensis TaxID=1870985 RepID=UPI000B4265D5|nr:triple tyrosine motif-containing protein [Arabiibacter massiliensis]
MVGEASVGEPIVFEGYADDYDHAIKAVEFSMDGGATWTGFSTKGAQAGRWVRWRFVYTPKSPGEYQLKVRSVNDQGKASPLAAVVSFSVD